MVPVEPQDKVLVSEKFFDTAHGGLECTVCHQGDDSSNDKDGAHKGFKPQPSVTDARSTCGGCHAEISETAPDSLHATLATFAGFLKTRASDETWDAIDHGRERHCASCHASCGTCHVSKPKYVGAGFVDGHVFNASPDPVNQCTACHGSRVGSEYFGSRGQGDVHLSKYTMSCRDCHTAVEMHAAAPEGLKNRYHLPQAPRCIDCHRDLQAGSVYEHRIHNQKVQCQVCHSQTYTNCYSCHTGTDEKGIPYFINKLDREDMKIGFNSDPISGEDVKYVMLRHVPVEPELFAQYVKDGFPSFDASPTWKRASPHNIQRRTWQNATCNNCHGQRDLFLAKDDLLEFEVKANSGLIVADDQVPSQRRRSQKLAIDTSGVRHSRIADVSWLAEHLGDERVVVVDARGKKDYLKAHIPGAINLNPGLPNELRTPASDQSPLRLQSAERLAEVFGGYGLAAGDYIVVYCERGQSSGFLLSVLDYAGAENISLLNGGITAWKQAGLETTSEETAYEAKEFKVSLRKDLLVDNEFVNANLDNPDVVIVDVRTLQHSMLYGKHRLASRAGRVPGSVQLPVFGLYEDHSYIKSPEELLWVLKDRNIRKHKTIVTSCNTGVWAGAAHFILRYLGYPDVRVHDESWIGWID